MYLTQRGVTLEISELFVFIRRMAFTEQPPYELAWEQALGRSYSEEEWTKAYNLTHSLFLSKHYQEKKYKFLIQVV